MWYRNLTYYYYRASSIEFGQVPQAIYTETGTEKRLANAEKTQEKERQEMAKLEERDGEQTNPVESNRIR
jgi:hypothetical protein